MGPFHLFLRTQVSENAEVEGPLLLDVYCDQLLVLDGCGFVLVGACALSMDTGTLARVCHVGPAVPHLQAAMLMFAAYSTLKPCMAPPTAKVLQITAKHS
jgi:hypothetical protein